MFGLGLTRANQVTGKGAGQYTMYASTSSAWHHITKNFMVASPYTYFTHTSTTSHLFPELVLFAPSAPYYPTQHYVTPRLIT